MILPKLVPPSVVSKFNIPRYQDHFIDSEETESRIEHPILRIIEQYKNHPSIITINNNNDFSFQDITKSEINQEISSLDSSKVCQKLDRPTNIIKANPDIFTEAIHKDLNKRLEVSNFL